MPNLCIIARMACDRNTPLMLVEAGLDRLAIAQRQWQFLEQWRREAKQRRRETKARRTKVSKIKGESNGEAE